MGAEGSLAKTPKGVYLRPVALFCAGYALCRVCFEAARSFEGLSGEALEAGKLLGLGAALVLIYLVNPSWRRRWLWAVPYLCLAAGLALCGVVAGGFGEHGTGLVAALLVGAGASSAMVGWFEYCGRLPARQIVLALVASFAVSSVLMLGLGAISGGLALVLVVALCAAGAWVLGLIRHRGGAAVEVDLPVAVRSVRPGLSRLVPLDVVVWCVVVGLTFGLLEGGAGVAISGQFIDSVGRLVPCVAVFVCLVAGSEYVDLRYFYAMTLPLLVAALALSGFADASPMLAGLLFCMGSAVSRIITYAIVLTRAREAQMSAAFGCAVVMALNALSHSVGAHIVTDALFEQHRSMLLAVVIAVDVTVIVLLLIHELDRFSGMGLGFALAGPSKEEASAERLGHLADKVGLTPRERTVLMHMAEGKSNVEISDALFISRGAVRSHTSRIYEKLGVHSRQEFDALVATMV